MKIIKFKGIDSFNRPVFVSVESPKASMAATDILLET